jgi:alpha-2-macroglobulin
LLIQSPITGTALLALERAGVHSEQLVAINGPLTTVALPISADFAPNIFAQVHLFAPAPTTEQPNRTGEGRLLTAQTELSVPATAQQLRVAVTSDAAQYSPGALAFMPASHWRWLMRQFMPCNWI